MKVAAVAALHGADVIALLALPREDFVVAALVYAEADRIHMERMNAVVAATAEGTGRWTASMVARLFRKR